MAQIKKQYLTAHRESFSKLSISSEPYISIAHTLKNSKLKSTLPPQIQSCGSSKKKNLENHHASLYTIRGQRALHSHYHHQSISQSKQAHTAAPIVQSLAVITKLQPQPPLYSCNLRPRPLIHTQTHILTKFSPVTSSYSILYPTKRLRSRGVRLRNYASLITYITHTHTDTGGIKAPRAARKYDEWRFLTAGIYNGESINASGSFLNARRGARERAALSQARDLKASCASCYSSSISRASYSLRDMSFFFYGLRHTMRESI